MGTDSRLAEVVVPQGSRAGGKSIMELGLPRGALVVLVVRGSDSMVPTGATVVHEGDKLVMLADEGAREEVVGKL